MKVKTSSWHYRLNTWAWDDVPKSLCPYVDKLILAVVLAPILYGYKLLSEKLQMVFWLILIYVGNLVLVYPFFGATAFYIVSFGFLIAGLALTIVVGLSKLLKALGKKEAGEPRKKERPAKIKKPEEPNLFSEWLRAKHRKICPLLDFTEETTEW